ncbi:MAG: phosphatidylserine decarboxylase family protein [Salibacteraceae bacterium]
MRFHKEGKRSILLASIVSISIILIASYLFADVESAKPIAIGIATVLIASILQFFRNPKRRSLQLEDVILAPADGKVVVIEDVDDPEYFDEKVTQISIFMSPINVHINWYPISGKIVYSKYHPGKYLVAWHPKSSTDNERHSIVIENPIYGKVLAKQIAGAMARRIVNYSKISEQVNQGAEMGFIKFGSRVDLLIPKNVKIEVSLDQKTIGGQTILATFNK